MINREQIHAIVSLILLIFSLVLIWQIHISDFGYALLMCMNFVWILYTAWKKEGLSPYFFFLGTFILLFIGGRFWAELIMPGEFDLRRGNFFNEHYLRDNLWLPSLTYILLFLHLSTAGYILLKRHNQGKPILTVKQQKENITINIILFLVFCMLAPHTLYDVYTKLVIASSGGDGYLSLYLEQTENVSAGSGLIASMIYVFLGIALVYGNKQIKLLYLILIFIKAFVFILIGQRAKFGSMLLFFLWYYFKDRKVNIAKLAVIAGGSLFLLLWIASLSIREMGTENTLSPLNALCQFLHLQGVSLTTFTSSQEIENYPTLPYFVSFIPGIASLTTMFTPISGEEAAFANYLAYSLSPETFATGHGLGWTLLSDIYLYAGRTYTLFTILSALFGIGCAYIEDRSKVSPFAAVIVNTIFLNLTFLPRAGLYTIIPLIVWTWLIYTLLMNFSGTFRNVSLQYLEPIKQTA